MNDAPLFSRPSNEKELDYRADPAARRVRIERLSVSQPCSAAM